MSNKEKFKQLNFLQKIEYIWEYYHIPFIAILITVATILVMFNSILSVQTQPCDTHIIMMGRAYISEEIFDPYEAGLQVNKSVAIEVLTGDLTETSDPEAIMVNEVLFMAKVQSQEADIFLLSELKHFPLIETHGLDGFADLEQIPELKSIIDKLDESMLERSINPIDGKEYLFGIRLDSAHLESIMEGLLLKEDLILSINAYAKDIDHAVDTVKYLLGE